MKFLFFDVECSNCHDGIGKLCEFGYVLTDEKFNILAKDDIPMSPGQGRENRFDLISRKHERDLILAYEHDFYYSQPEFPTFYERIKKLMCDKDTICFAYSMGNDLRHMHNACKRYRKEPLNYICYDVQMLVANHLEKKGQMSLETACREIVGPSSMIGLEEHLSRDDAKMEMLILEAICVLEQKDSMTLLNESPFAKTNSLEFFEKIRQRNIKRRMKAAGHDLYRSLISSEDELDLEENKGKRYNISGDLKCHIEELKKTVEVIKRNNGIFSNNLSKTDFFIVLDDKNKEDIIKSGKFFFDGEIITYKEFIAND